MTIIPFQQFKDVGPGPRLSVINAFLLKIVENRNRQKYEYLLILVFYNVLHSTETQLRVHWTPNTCLCLRWDQWCDGHLNRIRLSITAHITNHWSPLVTPMATSAAATDSDPLDHDLVEEGRARIMRLPFVFYNKVQQFNRDIRYRWKLASTTLTSDKF